MKTKSTEERIPIVTRFILKFQMYFCCKQKHTAASKDQWDNEWGLYLPSDRYNSDQIPGNFEIGIHPMSLASSIAVEMQCGGVDGDDTWDEIGKERVWTKCVTPDAGKRVYTIQCCFRPPWKNGVITPVKQPRICLLFRGTGKRIKLEEKKRWHPDAVVIFQKKAWFDRPAALEWLKKCFKPDTDASRHKVYSAHVPCMAVWCTGMTIVAMQVLLMDNLDSQKEQAYKTFLLDKCNTAAWFGPAGNTEHWQPVDRHVGKKIKDEMYELMDAKIEEFCDSQEGEIGTLPMSGTTHALPQLLPHSICLMRHWCCMCREEDHHYSCCSYCMGDNLYKPSGAVVESI